MKKIILSLLLSFCFLSPIVNAEAQIQNISLSDKSEIFSSNAVENKFFISFSQINPLKNIAKNIHPMPVFITLILLITLIYTFMLKKMRDSYIGASIQHSSYDQVENLSAVAQVSEDENYFEMESESEEADLNFCDIPTLPENILKAALIDTESTIITKALFGTDKKIIAAIVRNLSDLSRESVKIELKSFVKKPSNMEIEEAKEIITCKLKSGVNSKSSCELAAIF